MSPENSFIYKKEPKEPISCSGQLEPTWRGLVAGGVITNTHIGGYGFESRCARAFFFVGFWCFGAQVAARTKRRVVRGRTGGSCKFGGWPRVAYFPRFFSMRVLRFIMLGGCWGQNMDFGHVAPAGPQNGLRSEKCLFWHHGRSQQTYPHASSKRDLHANSA